MRGRRFCPGSTLSASLAADRHSPAIPIRMPAQTCVQTHGIWPVWTTGPDVRHAPGRGAAPSCPVKLTLRCEACEAGLVACGEPALSKGTPGDRRELPPASPERARPRPPLPCSYRRAPRAHPRTPVPWEAPDGEACLEQKACCTKCPKHFPSWSVLVGVLRRHRSNGVCVCACGGTHVQRGTQRTEAV